MLPSPARSWQPRRARRAWDDRCIMCLLVAFTLNAAAASSLTNDHPVLVTRGVDACVPQSSEDVQEIRPNFVEAFQVHSNLGGLGPDRGSPTIRYASAVATSTPAMPDVLLAYFCGELPEEVRAFVLQWPDGSARACDPYESVANYEQTRQYVSTSNVVARGAHVAAVAWSGRIADAPTDATGIIFNSGLLNGTIGEDDHDIQGRHVPHQPPGSIPGVSGLNLDFEIDHIPADWVPGMAGPVNWTVGFRQALGCYPWKAHANDTCLKTALMRGATVGPPNSWPWGAQRGAPEGSALLTSEQARSILTPVDDRPQGGRLCNLMGGSGVPGQDTAGCPDPTGYHELIMVSQLSLVRWLTNTPSAVCPYLEGHMWRPLSERRQYSCASSALCPDALSQTLVSCPPAAQLGAGVTGYCVDSAGIALPVPEPLHWVPRHSAPASHPRMTCGYTSEFGQRADLLVTNRSQYSPANVLATQINVEFAQINTLTSVPADPSLPNGPRVGNNLGLRIYGKFTCCLGADATCSRFFTLRRLSSTAIRCPSSVAAGYVCYPAGTQCSPSGQCENVNLLLPRSSQGYLLASAERKALYSCPFENNTFVSPFVRTEWALQLFDFDGSTCDSTIAECTAMQSYYQGNYPPPFRQFNTEFPKGGVTEVAGMERVSSILFPEIHAAPPRNYVMDHSGAELVTLGPLGASSPMFHVNETVRVCETTSFRDEPCTELDITITQAMDGYVDPRGITVPTTYSVVAKSTTVGYGHDNAYDVENLDKQQAARSIIFKGPASTGYTDLWFNMTLADDAPDRLYRMGGRNLLFTGQMTERVCPQPQPPSLPPPPITPPQPPPSPMMPPPRRRRGHRRHRHCGHRYRHNHHCRRLCRCRRRRRRRRPHRQYLHHHPHLLCCRSRHPHHHCIHRHPQRCPLPLLLHHRPCRRRRSPCRRHHCCHRLQFPVGRSRRSLRRCRHRLRRHHYRLRCRHLRRLAQRQTRHLFRSRDHRSRVHPHPAHLLRPIHHRLCRSRLLSHPLHRPDRRYLRHFLRVRATTRSMRLRSPVFGHFWMPIASRRR